MDVRHLAAALQSVAAQTRRPDQVVIVVDGPVSDAHHDQLCEHPSVDRVDLPERSGAGPALAAGLALCWGSLVARADSDDFNEPYRLEVQVAMMEATGADVCSAAMTEIVGDPPVTVGVRSTSLTHESAVKRMRVANPVNHPTAMFRREVAVAAGGYQPLAFLEDYDLWARILAGGGRFVGTAEPLVRFRIDGLHLRRSAPGIDRAERELQRRLVAYGIITRRRALLNVLIRSVYRKIPDRLKDVTYAVLFRRRSR